MFSNPYQIINCLNDSLRIAGSLNYRVMLVLPGKANQLITAICNAFLTLNGEHALEPDALKNMTSSTDYIIHVPNRRSNSDVSDEINALLGIEHSCVVFDALDEFNERLFAAAAGTVTAGGLLVLRTPPLHDWAEQQHIASNSSEQSVFISRLCEKLILHHSLNATASNATASTVEAEHYNTLNEIPANSAFFIAAQTQQNTVAHLRCTDSSGLPAWLIDQNAMLESLVNNLQNNAQSVSVVLGDRGRGKSALIGRALNKILEYDSIETRSVTITASRSSACRILFKHAQHTIPFVPIEKALADAHDVLIVEEAGSIPIPVLEQLMSQSKSIVFATTVQGYEGAGRGFALRFSKRLDSLKPNWLKINPTLPIRWSKNDPLEAFVNDALLLKTRLSPITGSDHLSTRNSQVTLIEKQNLAGNDKLLTELYGLLVQAHYQTTPADLRNLLDQPNLLVFAQHTRQILTGAALVAIEGQIPVALHQAILHKQRRLPDQLLPQLLAQCSGQTNVLPKRLARIVRIAIHPAIHHQGFGTHLFEQMYKQLTTNELEQTGVHAIGASFGADQSTLSFWLKQGLTPIHYGYKSNPRSALRAACLMRSSHPPTKQSIDKACSILLLNTRAQLSSEDLADPVQQQLLVATESAKTASLSEIENKRLIQDFCFSRRSFMDSVGLIMGSTLFVDSDAVQHTLRNTLQGYRTMSPTARRVAEERLRAVLLESGISCEI